MTPVIVCADDYGLTPGISTAIRDLAEAGRITATSAMTLSPHWPAEGAKLRALAGRVSVGLHFTLTELGPLARLPALAPEGRFPPLKNVLVRALARRLSAEEIRRELEAQLDRFAAVMERPPSHIDGHHHVHNLPIVRDVVLDVVRRRFANGGMYLRFCDEPLVAIVRRGIAVPQAVTISWLGRRLATEARAAGVAGNAGFRGVRAFTDAEDTAALFRTALTDPRPGMMIMCHPGTGAAEPDIPDPINACRARELAFLQSDAWPDMVAAAGVTLTPISVDSSS